MSSSSETDISQRRQNLREEMLQAEEEFIRIQTITAEVLSVKAHRNIYGKRGKVLFLVSKKDIPAFLDERRQAYINSQNRLDMAKTKFAEFVNSC